MDEATREALRDAALALDSCDPGADPSELTPLGERLAERRIVSLGTAKQESGGSWGVQNHVLRHLVTERDVRVVCLDAEFTAVEALDAYVVGDTDDLGLDPPRLRHSSLPGGPVVECVRWLRRHNTRQAREDRVRLYGLGARGPAAVVDRLRSYLDRVDPAFLETVRHNLDVVAGLDAPPERESVTRAGGVIDQGAPTSDADTRDLLDEADRLLPALRERLTEYRGEYTSTGGHDAWEHAVQYVTLLEQAASLQRPLEQHAAGLLEQTEAIGQFCHLDALARADNLDWVLGVEDATSTALLARTHQIARVEQNVAGEGTTAELLGALLAARYGDAYYALGATAEPEQSRPAIDYGAATGGPDTHPTETVPEGLASIDAPAVLLDFERAREDDRLAAWLDEAEFADAFDGCCLLSDRKSGES